MKKVLFSIAASMLLFVVVQAQVVRDADVPTGVKAKMTSMFPSATAVVWTKDMPGFITSDFVQNKTKMSATFSTSGSWVSTETAVKIDAMPVAATDYIKTNYPDGKVNGCVLAETSTKKTYECRVKTQGLVYELVFDTEGKLLMKPQVADN